MSAGAPSTRPNLRIKYHLLKALFNKPFKAFFSVLSLAALSTVNGTLVLLIGYAIKASDWIDNREAAYMGVVSGAALLPYTTFVVAAFLCQFEAICVYSAWAHEKGIRDGFTGIHESEDWATVQAGDTLPNKSKKGPEYSGWLALIPLGLFHIPGMTLFGTICGTIGAPITKIDTARASLIRGAIGGAIVGGGYLLLLIWVSVFLYTTEVKLPVFQPKSLPKEGKDAEAGLAKEAPEHNVQLKKGNKRPSSIAKSDEGLVRPASPNNAGASTILSSSKRESMRNYLDHDSIEKSYAAALAATTIGSQESSFDRPYSVKTEQSSTSLVGKHKSRALDGAKFSSASVSPTGRHALDSNKTENFESDLKSPGTAVI